MMNDHSMAYILLTDHNRVVCVHVPAFAAIQLIALQQRLAKEAPKLSTRPSLLQALMATPQCEWIDPAVEQCDGLQYVAQLERTFAQLSEPQYPLISLLTEIRALLAQLEQWEEERLHP